MTTQATMTDDWKRETAAAWRNLAFRRRLLAGEMPSTCISLGPGHLISSLGGRTICPDAEGFGRTARAVLGAAVYAARLALRADGDAGAAVADHDVQAMIRAYVGQPDASHVSPDSRLAQVGQAILDIVPTGGVSRSRAMQMLADIGRLIGHDTWARLTPQDIGFDPTLHGMSVVC